MNELQKIFDYEGVQVRTAIVNNAPVMCAKDACDLLDIMWNGAATIQRISDKHKGVTKFPTPSGEQEMFYVDEAGFYKLAMRSNKPDAEKVQDWVAEEVLPSIRKHGAYITETKIEELLANPDTIIQLATTIKQERAARIAAEQSLAIAQPKAETFDTIAEDEGFLLTVGLIAKTACLTGLNETEVRNILRDEGILCKTKNEITAEAEKNGYGRMIIEYVSFGGGRAKAIPVPKFRGKTIDLVVSIWKRKTGKLF